MMAVPAMKAPPKKRTPKVTQEPPAPEPMAVVDVSVLSENLDRALRLVTRAVPRTSIGSPMHERLLFEPDEGRLRITAAGIEAQMSVWIGAKLDARGSWLMKPRDLARFARGSHGFFRFTRKAGEKPVSVALATGDADGLTLEYTAADGDPADWPSTWATFEPGRVMTFPAERFVADLDRAFGCASAWEEMRPALTGVAFKNTAEGLTISAADGFRLAVIKRPAVDAETWEFILSAQGVRLMLAVAKGCHEDVQLEVNATQARMSISDVVVTCGLIQGAYPFAPAENLIPKEVVNRFTFPRAAFSQALSYAEKVAGNGSGIVRIEGSDDGPFVTISAKGFDEERVSVRVPLVGDPLKDAEARIALNALYLLDVAKAFRGAATLELAFTTASAQGVFSDPSDPTLRIVVMPMFVQW